MASFFKKRGRASKEEAHLINSINEIIRGNPDLENQINTIASNKSDLEDILSKIKESSIENQEPQSEEQEEENHFNNDEIENPMSNENSQSNEMYDPFANPTVERAYTHGSGVNSNDTNVEIHDIPEPAINPIDEIEDVDEIEDDIPNEEEEKETPRKDLSDLSDSQKKKAAKQTAEAILVAYKTHITRPFKHFSKFNLDKLNKQHLEDEINLQMEIELPDGTDCTILEYIESFNIQVDEAFEIDEESIDSIREPLIEVLLQQEAVMTPVQRLLFGLGSHIVTMSISTIKLASSRNGMLDFMKEAHEQKMQAMKQREASVNRPKKSSTENNNSDNIVVEEDEENIKATNITTEEAEKEAQLVIDGIENAEELELDDK